MKNNNMHEGYLVKLKHPYLTDSQGLKSQAAIGWAEEHFEKGTIFEVEKLMISYYEKGISYVALKETPYRIYCHDFELVFDAV